MTGFSLAQRPEIRRRLDALQRDSDRLAIAGFVLLLGLAVAYIMHRGAGDTFFYDEWGYIENRRSGLHAIFAADNGHMLVLNFALYQLLFHTVGLQHYWVYRAVEVTAHVILLSVMFTFVRRRLGGVAALLILVPIAFLGNGWQFLLWGAIGAGFILSIAFCVMAVMTLEVPGLRRDILACLLLVIGLAWSDYTIVFLVGIAVQLLWRGRLRAAWIWALPLVLYICWYAVYHEHVASLRDNLTAAPAFGLDSLGASAAGLLGVNQTWATALAVALILGLIWRVTRPARLSPVLVSLVIAGAGFWLLLGLGRLQVSDADAPRYVYVGAVFIVLIGAEAVRGRVLSGRILIVGVVVALIALLGNIRAFGGGEGELSASSTQVRAELGALALARSTAPPGLVLDSHYAPQIIAGQWFAAVDALHSSPADTPSQILAAPQSARLAADETLMHAGGLAVSGISTPPAAAPIAPAVEGVQLGRTVRSQGCVTFRPDGADSFVDVALPPSGLAIRTLGAATASVQARRFAAQFLNAPIAQLTAHGPGIELRSTPDHPSPPWSVRILPENGRITACTVG